MKLILAISFMFALGVSYGQTAQTSTQPSDVRLFAQSMFSISTQAELDQLTYSIYANHPEVEMVRLDLITQRAFVVTTGLQSLSESDFISWFGGHANTVTCVQIGVYGVDPMNPFPFTNCQ